MQTTLLGLGIAIILALVSALVAPLVVDWGNYRAAFEAEAGRLTGLTVRVNGSIDARILPSPLVKLNDVEVGEGGQAPLVRAETLELEVGLGSLLQGKIEAKDLHLVAPQISLGLDRSGAIDWPRLSPSFHPEALSISRLRVEDGRIVLTDAASGAHLLLQKFWFNGDVRSLVGPFAGQGAFVAGDELFGYRLSGTRGSGGFKIKFGLDPSDHPLTTDFEGTVSLDRGVPQFDGTFALARPVGAALANGQRVVSEPWHAGGRLRATPAAASLDDAAFQYGPDEGAIDVNGHARLTFGENPHLEGAVSALEVDVDRALATPDLTRRPPLLVIKSLLETLPASIELPMPAHIGVGIEAVTIGGTAIQSLHGDVRFDGVGWRLDNVGFRAPGSTEVTLSGRLEDTLYGAVFSGPATLQSTDLDMLLLWLNGHNGLPTGEAKSMTAHGDLTIATDRVAVDRLAATLDQESVEGRLAYSFAAATRPASFDADLRAREFDLDALSAFAEAATTDGSFALPHAGSLALDIGKATLAGLDAEALKAQIKFDAGALQVDRLSVGDLGGATLNVSGRIDALSSRPRGRMTLDLDAHDLAGVALVVGKFSPRVADKLNQFADRLLPAKLHATLTVDRAVKDGSTATLSLNGQTGTVQIAVNAEATGEPSALGDAMVHVDSRLETVDATALSALLGVDQIVAVDHLPGRATLSADGPLNGELRVDGQVSASGANAAVRGTVRLRGGPAPSAALQVLASAADLRPLQHIMSGQPGPAVPISARTAVTVAGSHVTFGAISVKVGKASVGGRVALDLSQPKQIDGDIEVDDADAAGVAAMLLGLPSKPLTALGPWSSAPLGAGAFGVVNGAVTFKLAHAAFTSALTARDLKGVARFHGSEIAVGDVDGALAGGHLTGTLSFRRTADGLATHGNLVLAGADAATIIAPGRNVVDGELAMALQVDTLGASPAALVGSLHGSGTMTLTNAHFSGLDTTAFTAAIAATDSNGSIDRSKVQTAVSATMAKGGLAVPHGDVALTIASGQVSAANATLEASGGAALSLNGRLDLGSGLIAARLTLSGDPPAHALIRARPELEVALDGPLATPRSTLDVSALTSWLTLRAAELQTRRIEAIEANRRNSMVDPVVRPDTPIVHPAPSGAVVELAMPPNMPTTPPAGARGLELLQPDQPAVSDGSRPATAGGPQATAPPLPPPRTIRPLAPPTGASSGAPSAEPSRRSPPPQPAKPSGRGGSSERSGLDWLFRPQN
ncbi:MAG TPA: AsmA family protein [Xanthobacteraceae bacterium]